MIVLNQHVARTHDLVNFLLFCGNDEILLLKTIEYNSSIRRNRNSPWDEFIQKLTSIEYCDLASLTEYPLEGGRCSY